MNYQEYLASPKWKRIRARILKRDRYRCRSCGARAWQVHHGSYDKRTMLGADDRQLYSLCGPCHEAVTFGVTGQKRPMAEVRKLSAVLNERPPKPKKQRAKKVVPKRRRLTLEEVRAESLEYAQGKRFV